MRPREVRQGCRSSRASRGHSGKTRRCRRRCSFDRDGRARGQRADGSAGRLLDGGGSCPQGDPRDGDQQDGDPLYLRAAAAPGDQGQGADGGGTQGLLQDRASGDDPRLVSSARRPQIRQLGYTKIRDALRGLKIEIGRTTLRVSRAAHSPPWTYFAVVEICSCPTRCITPARGAPELASIVARECLKS